MTSRKVLVLYPRGLPCTLHQLHTGKREKPRVTVSLPVGYTPKKKYPLLVFLRGGDGGVGDTVERPEAIAGDLPLLCANFPLFKKGPLDRTLEPEGLLVDNDDAEVIRKAYTIILRLIRKRIPNVQWKRSIIGGFSNGGHTTSVILSNGDPFLLKHFCGYYIVDAGMGAYDRLKYTRGKKLFVMYGEKTTGWRKTIIIPMCESIVYKARRMGIDVRKVVMKNTGHAFPDRYHPHLRRWIRDIATRPAQ